MYPQTTPPQAPNLTSLLGPTWCSGPTASPGSSKCCGCGALVVGSHAARAVAHARHAQEFMSDGGVFIVGYVSRAGDTDVRARARLRRWPYGGCNTGDRRSFDGSWRLRLCSRNWVWHQHLRIKPQQVVVVVAAVTAAARVRRRRLRRSCSCGGGTGAMLHSREFVARGVYIGMRACFEACRYIWCGLAWLRVEL